MLRHRAQLLLDPLERSAQRRAAGHRLLNIERSQDQAAPGTGW